MAGLAAAAVLEALKEGGVVMMTGGLMSVAIMIGI
jgi:hypothetical protein